MGNIKILKRKCIVSQQYVIPRIQCIVKIFSSTKTSPPIHHQLEGKVWSVCHNVVIMCKILILLCRRGYGRFGTKPTITSPTSGNKSRLFEITSKLTTRNQFDFARYTKILNLTSHNKQIELIQPDGVFGPTIIAIYLFTIIYNKKNYDHHK